MSKAFTKEDDDAPERPLVRPSASMGQTPLTPDGAQRLHDELAALGEKVTGKDASRRAELQQILASATIIPPPAPPWNQVAFGAFVTVKDSAGEETTYRIVGPAEIDLDKNWINAASPIGRALLKAMLGQQVKFRIPAGEQNWEIVAIRYSGT